MKIKAHHLLLLSSTLLSASAFANDAAAETTPAAAPETTATATVAPTPTATTEVAAADTKPAAEAAKDKDVAPTPGETMPLIMFEDAPLNDVIKTLARQAGINFQFDPRVSNPPPGPDGKAPTPPNVATPAWMAGQAGRLEQVNEAYAVMLAGKLARGVIVM